MAARAGKQFLERLRSTKRQLWLEGERVDDVTTHPALAGAAHTLAGIFDRQHVFPDECLIPDPETGEPINVGHMIPRSIDDLKRYLTSATRNRINNHLRNVDKSRAYALVDGILAAGRKPAP